MKKRHHIIPLGSLAASIGVETPVVDLGSHTRVVLMVGGTSGASVVVRGTPIGLPTGRVKSDVLAGQTQVIIAGGEQFPAGEQDLRIGSEVELITSHSAGSQVFNVVGGLAGSHKRGTLVEYVDSTDPRTFYDWSNPSVTTSRMVTYSYMPRFIKVVNATTVAISSIYVDVVREIA